MRAGKVGSWTVWDPNVSFGHPLLAQPNTRVAYPPAWVNLVLDRSSSPDVQGKRAIRGFLATAPGQATPGAVDRPAHAR